MSNLGALSSYAFAIQQVQLSIMKNSIENQHQAIEILLGDDNRSIAPSDLIGTCVNIEL
jgi:hypothetical protein